MRAAKLRINTDLLRTILRLPDDTQIHFAEWVDWRNGGVVGSSMIELTVEHPDLPHVQEGCFIPKTQAIYRTDYTKKEPVATFEKWADSPKLYGLPESFTYSDGTKPAAETDVLNVYARLDARGRQTKASDKPLILKPELLLIRVHRRQHAVRC